MLKWFKEFGSGFVVGTTDIVPGISGGTVLFLLGLYERTIAAISQFKADAVITLLRHTAGAAFGKNRAESWKNLASHAQKLDIPFLIRLLTGIISAILLLSGLLKFLLENHFAHTFSFIFGLILASIVFSTRMHKVKRPIHIVHFMVGAAVAVSVISSVNPIDAAMAKSERYRIKAVEIMMAEMPAADSSLAAAAVASLGATDTIFPSRRFSAGSTALRYTGHYSAGELAFAGMSGAVAICATIMPGPSGSLVLILLGQYHEALTAISNLKTLQLDYFIFLAIMAGGMGIGMLAFSRVINHILKRYYNGAVAFMIGVTTGSLYALWPFKSFDVLSLYEKGPGGIITLNDFAVVRTNTPVMPDSIEIILAGALFCGLGVGIMVALERFGAKSRF